MTRTALARLEVTTATSDAYRSAQLDPQRAALNRLLGQPGAGMTVKRLEKQLLAREERIKSKLDHVTDPGVTFEQTGIDYLVVDELHDYKNLTTPSNIRDAAIDGSLRAEDLHMKVSYLRDRHNGRALTGATATPIANSITEAYVMQQYLRPDLLHKAGVHDFDTWAGTFASTVDEMEMSPDGGSWRMKTRFAKFRNVPELLRMWHVAADVKTAEDLALPTPPLAARVDGQRAPRTVVVAPSAAQVEFVTSLGERAEAVRNGSVEPTEDNMLKISTEGRAAALDLRLLPHVLDAQQAAADPALYTDDGPGKLEVAAAQIAATWRQHADRRYTDRDGNDHPRPGALQLVFSDLGTPREEWNVYDALRADLVSRGVPAAQVAFIHSARNDREKAQLFEACRTGAVQVLIGSTAKMGVGTNVQARAVALHHLDCPWRPADLAQREGRIERQGNQNPEIAIYRYVTEGTFDTYSWQTVERKARFIGQVMKGRLDSREIDDIGQDALSYSEVKALASGDPLVLDKAEADNTVASLERLRRAHDRGQTMLRHTVSSTERHLLELHGQVPALRAALAARTPTKGEQFVATINGVRYDERAAAAAALASLMAPLVARQWGRVPALAGTVATLGGFTATALVETTSQGPVAAVQFTGCPARPVTYTAQDLAQPGPGLIVRLENSLATMDRTLIDVERSIATLTEERDRAAQRLGQPFDRMDQLVAARAHRATIDAKMAAAHQPAEPNPPRPTATPPESTPAQHDRPTAPTAEKTGWELVQSAYAPTRAGVAAAKVRNSSRSRRTPDRAAQRHNENER